MKNPIKIKYLLTASLVAVVAFSYGMYELRQRREYRSKITALASELNSPQRNSDDVRRLLRQPRFQGLNLRDESPSLWTVETPLEFGARNWVLFIELHDSKVVALRVRTIDSMNERPHDAPPDSGYLERK